ncbi:3-oxoacyl-ACP reductase, partial [Cribrihabitans sp. XS_ASV171]
ILGAGAGCFALTRIYETEGVELASGEITPEEVAASFAEISDPTDQVELSDAFGQTRKYARKAAEARGMSLNWGE